MPERDLICTLGHVAVDVADFDGAVDDAIHVMGLREVERGADHAVFAAGPRLAEYVLHRADATALRALGLEAYDAASVDAVAERAQGAGMILLDETPSHPSLERAVTLATTEGHVFEVHTPFPRAHAPHHAGPGVNPRFIDHANLTADDTPAICAQLADGLGLRLSDTTPGQILSWFRAGNGRHHTIGVLKGPSGAVHHISWEFKAFADFQLLGDLLAERDRMIAYGPGRHGTGDNLFSYYVDRSGLMTECTAEMELIHDPAFEPRTVDPGPELQNYKVVNQWGAMPAPEWFAHSTPFASRTA